MTDKHVDAALRSAYARRADGDPSPALRVRVLGIPDGHATVRRRWGVPVLPRAALARVAVLAGVLATVIGGMFVVAGPGQSSPTPMGTTGPSRQPVESMLAPRLDILMDTWGLDFAASGLEPWDERRTDEAMFLGSSLSLGDDGRFEAGTGYGGGCDRFIGTYTVDGDHIHLDFDLINLGCDRGSPQQILAGLVTARTYALAECPPRREAGYLAAPCWTLTLSGDAGPALVYLNAL